MPWKEKNIPDKPVNVTAYVPGTVEYAPDEYLDVDSTTTTDEEPPDTYGVTFTPDEDSLIMIEEQDDVLAFDAILDECRDVFTERRIYGNHLKHDPFYIKSGIAVKAYRIFDDIKNGREIKRDTLVDLICYVAMKLSMGESNE